MSLSPISLTVAQLPAGLGSLGNGTSNFSGTITPGPGVQFGAFELPLPSQGGFAEGQRVNVRIVRTNGDVQVLVSAAPEEAAPTNVRRPSLLTALTRILDSLPQVRGASAESLLRLTPANLPVSRDNLAALFAALANDGRLGDHFTRVVQSLSRAAQAGIFSADTLRELEELLGPRAGTRAASHLAALRGGLREAATSLEAQLLASVTGDRVVSLRLLLAGLRNNEALEKFLKEGGSWTRFQRSLDAVVERLAAGSLPNLRGLEHPYLFFEIPFPPGAALRSAQFHLLPDRRGDRDGDESTGDRVAMDISTARLGDVWVEIHATTKECNCRIEAESDETLDAIRGEVDDLRSHLQRAGFDDTHIAVGTHQRDRWTRLANFLSPRDTLDVEA